MQWYLQWLREWDDTNDWYSHISGRLQGRGVRGNQMATTRLESFCPKSWDARTWVRRPVRCSTADGTRDPGVHWPLAGGSSFPAPLTSRLAISPAMANRIWSEGHTPCLGRRLKSQLRIPSLFPLPWVTIDGGCIIILGPRNKAPGAESQPPTYGHIACPQWSSVLKAALNLEWLAIASYVNLSWLIYVSMSMTTDCLRSNRGSHHFLAVCPWANHLAFVTEQSPL